MPGKDAGSPNSSALLGRLRTRHGSDWGRRFGCIVAGRPTSYSMSDSLSTVPSARSRRARLPITRSTSKGGMPVPGRLEAQVVGAEALGRRPRRARARRSGVRWRAPGARDRAPRSSCCRAAPMLSSQARTISASSVGSTLIAWSGLGQAACRACSASRCTRRPAPPSSRPPQAPAYGRRRRTGRERARA